ncbi:MAG TPA: hypothetical protein DEA08_16065 [Planctomycetes bacterium]|nr:hypothetical protein [Planctomycetota bacterium]
MKLATAESRSDLYPDRHLNVFVAYRSHTLDYNLTRALISTLRWSRPNLTRAFLERFARLETSANSFHFDLHACDYDDFDPAQVKQQSVLGISIAGRLAENLPPLDDAQQGALLLSMLRSPAMLNAPAEYRLDAMRKALARPELTPDDIDVLYHTLEELEEGCHPDGWIFSGEGEGLCVLIEAKLTQLLDLSQLQRYAEVYYGAEWSKDDMRLASWEEVARFFAEHRDDEDTRTSFLCGQLCDYLDLLGLGPFTGFRPYDFDMDAAHAVLPKFLKFAQRIQALAGERGLPLSEARVSATGARLDLVGYPGELCLDLHKEGMRVELRCGDGLGNQPGREAIDAILLKAGDGNPLSDAELPEGLNVRVERMRNEQGELFCERSIYSGPLVQAEFDEVLAELRRQHPPVEQARDAAGHVRQGRLSIGRLVPHSQAAGEANALEDQVLELAATLTRVARRLAEGS